MTAPLVSDTLVFGPAYLDRVVRVSVPLVDPLHGDPPLDGSVDGTVVDPVGSGLTLVDSSGNQIFLSLPNDWPGPFGTVAMGRPLSNRSGWRRAIAVQGWGDHLGGMGAGFAQALDGTLITALGPSRDPTSEVVIELLLAHAIPFDPIHVPDQPADWTLLVSGGATGDKLAIGFRGCASAIDPSFVRRWSNVAGRVRVVAAWPNQVVAEALQAPVPVVRVFAPSARNMTDRAYPLSGFADRVDLLCCNRREWELLADREQVAWRVGVLVITDGSAGAEIRFTTQEGEAGRVRVPSFPRVRPPQDTNRAGEAFAATLVRTLIDGGWSPGVVGQALVEHAAGRSAAAAALVLDRIDFGFPTVAEIDAALRNGRVT